MEIKQLKLDMDTGPTYAEIVCKRIIAYCDSQPRRLNQVATIKDIVRISNIISQDA